MAEAKLIEIPDFDFSGFYYPDIIRALIQFQRTNVPEITDEGDEEPFQQLLRSYALVGHLNNVLLDISANETLLPTARLLESVRGHLALIDVRLKQASPASADIVLEFSKVFDVPTNIVPLNSQFGTVETEDIAQILFETNESFTIQPTDEPAAIHAFTAGKIKIKDNAIEGGDIVEVETVQFRPGIEYVIGANILETLNNLTAAINNSTSQLIIGRVAAINDGVDIISVIPLDQAVETILITEIDNATDNFEVLSGGFGPNRTGIYSADSVFQNLFEDTPKAGDLIYVTHNDIMWDALEFVFDSAGSGINFAVEFQDNNFEDAKPDIVTNLGSNLEMDLTTLLGDTNRKGAVVRVVLSSTGAFELLVSDFVGGKNILTTKGLLGQALVSVDEQDYVVGSIWNEVSDTDDGTNGLTENGKIEYTLPQNVSQNWIKSTINTTEGHWLRLRVISVTAPVNPSVDRVRIDTGAQFLLVPATQGQTVADAPLGSSNGGPGQIFTLTFRPLIEGTLIVEVNEGSDFQEYNLKENFLASNSASKDYTLNISGDDIATIKFGDGVQGKVPTPGVDNIRAIYRIGADQDGNVGSSTITINKSGISFVNRLFNPRQAQGFDEKEGSTDQDLARLKIEGPATLRTRGRAIATPDFEFLAIQFEDSNGSELVARALAIEETFGVKTVELVVVGKSGALLTEAQRDELTNFFNGNKALGIDPVIVTNHEATIVNYTPRIIDVTATVTGGNEEQIKNAITALLNPDATFDDGVTKRWDFGQLIPIAVIISEIFEVDPVNIKNVIITVPAADVILDTRELPLAGSISVTVV